MKIISWNVNGIRAWYKKNLLTWLKKENPDIFCIQETKAHPDQLPEELKNINRYFSYFSSSQVKKGYSGVAVYTKIEPEKVGYGMGIEKFDQEGRILVLHYKDFILLNVYFPNGGQGEARLQYKMDFYNAFLKYINKLKKTTKKEIVFCGDVNTAHKEIDLARPKQNMKNTGFLPKERAWIDKVIEHGYIDTFRYFNPDKKNIYSYWDMKTFARDRNVGWRIDYFFISSNLKKRITGTDILTNVLGSDHCPIALELVF
ncbi:exodeoxyribonuclease III [Patescibacteria group bacterium]